MTIFKNGLKGAEWSIYYYLTITNLSEPISAGMIADSTMYHVTTVYRILKQLDEYGYITRHQDKPGQAYKYQLLNINKRIL